MSGIIANDTDEQRIMASQLIAQAMEWDAIAIEAERIASSAEPERASWESEYKPKAAHKAKLAELGSGNAALAKQARGIADALRAAAAEINSHADRVDSGEEENVAAIDAIDTSEIATNSNTAPLAAGSEGETGTHTT